MNQTLPSFLDELIKIAAVPVATPGLARSLINSLRSLGGSSANIAGSVKSLLTKHPNMWKYPAVATGGAVGLDWLRNQKKYRDAGKAMYEQAEAAGEV
jgi:hypothetical protein